MRTRVLLLVMIVAAPAAADVLPHDTLVADGIPPIPDAVAAKAAAYAEFRFASLMSWHPKERAMLISTRFGETAQTHLVRMPLGARTQLTFFKEPVAFAAFPRDPARAGEHFVLGRDTGGNEFYQIYRRDLRGGGLTLLTDGKSRNVASAQNDQGTLVAYSSNRRNGKDNDLYVVDPRDPKSDRMVAQVEGNGWSVLDFSPDGKSLLVDEFVSINEGYRWLFPLDGKGERRLLTPKGGDKVAYQGGQFSPDGKSFWAATDAGSEFLRLARFDLGGGPPRFVTEHIPWDVETFDLTRDGRTLAVVTNEDGTGVLHLFDARSGKELPRPKLPPGTVEAARWHESGRELGLVISSAQSPGDVWSLDARTGKVTRWTESETGGLDTSGLREPELVKWKSFDGRTISGYLYLPPGRFSGKRPVIINIHGGPESQFRPSFLGRTRYYLEEMGVALIFPNVRGSSGYGKTFLTLDDGAKREDSVKDIGALLDWVGTRPELDASRIMVTGGSYGGYMTFAVSYHYADRIRCSLPVVGITNFTSFLERTEAYRRDLRRAEYGDERDPQMRAFFAKIAPLSNASRMTKPMFVVHGKNDPRVPVGESEQIVKTLKKQGTPVWYLVATDEGHGFRKKKNADYQFFATVAFIERHLLK